MISSSNRLPHFGTYQDAMWSGEPFLYHSLLSTSLNLKLLGPRECVDAAVAAYDSGKAPINASRGSCGRSSAGASSSAASTGARGPIYGERNGSISTGGCQRSTGPARPTWQCMRECIGQVLTHGYGHHIQRLMVTGNFALIAGVDPREISDWYLGMYVDAIDWVTLPNTLGMVMHADGGVVGTKPYAASASTSSG
jgi:deoxyribodipyrimidine photolyase-related protein